MRRRGVYFGAGVLVRARRRLPHGACDTCSGGPEYAQGYFTTKACRNATGSAEATCAAAPLTLAQETETALPNAPDANGLTYYQSLVSGGTNQYAYTPDVRIVNFDSLPAGPFQLTNGTNSAAPGYSLTSAAARNQASRDLTKGRHAAASSASSKRSRASLNALKRESSAAASPRALSRQAHSAARTRSAAERSAAAAKGARTRASRPP